MWRRSRFNVLFLILGILLMISGAASAQSGQAATENPPIAQPLVREGDFAIDLMDALNLGQAASETEAESTLGSFGIIPRNGWIADYPVTPDIIDEVRAAVIDAATSGKLLGGKDSAMAAFDKVITGYNMPVGPAREQLSGEAPGTNYPDPGDLNDYYNTAGPPVVTYYAPPPDYAYLYTWVPYPFWWYSYWAPGFFVLVDFHVMVHGHGHGHGGWCSNHYRDPGTGRMMRLDATNRVHSGTFVDARGTQKLSPSAQRSAQAIRQFRGYGVSGPSAATRSSVFDRHDNSRFERAASSRGYQSRSRANQLPARGPTVTRGGSGANRGASGGVSRSGGSGGYHGGGGGRSR